MKKKIKKSSTKKNAWGSKKSKKKSASFKKELQSLFPTEGICTKCGKKVTSVRLGTEVYCQNHRPENEMSKMSKSDEEAVRKRLKYFGIRLKF